jgi:septum formation protein
MRLTSHVSARCASGDECETPLFYISFSFLAQISTNKPDKYFIIVRSFQDRQTDTLQAMVLTSCMLALILANTTTSAFPANLNKIFLRQRTSRSVRPASTPIFGNLKMAITTEASCLLVSVIDRIGSEEGCVRLVLASQSPRRREILDMMGLRGKYTTTPSPLNETALQQQLLAQKDISSIEYTQRLAEAKAQALAEAQAFTITSPTLYLGSDTIVEYNERIMEKPRDAQQAKEMLRTLSGKEHQVHTGVAIVRVEVGGSMSLITSFVDTAQVTFTELTDTDIEAYVLTGEPMDKAGGYGIQGECVCVCVCVCVWSVVTCS